MSDSIKLTLNSEFRILLLLAIALAGEICIGGQ